VFERALMEAVPLTDKTVPSGELDLALRRISEGEAPSLSTFIRSRASLAQIREFVIHRSAYQLKEADPHSWAIARFSGAPKAALIEIQVDEHGRGRVEWIHAELFARTMSALGLDRAYGCLPRPDSRHHTGHGQPDVAVRASPALAGAIVGHRALFEMTSSIPIAVTPTGCDDWDSVRRQPCSSTNTSPPMPCTRTSPRSISPEGLWPRIRACARASFGGPVA
jgi:Iron-containing redox enzyme